MNIVTDKAAVLNGVIVLQEGVEPTFDELTQSCLVLRRDGNGIRVVKDRYAMFHGVKWIDHDDN